MSPAIAGRISYPGGLSIARNRLHAGTRMGYEGKFQAAYDTAWWRDAGLSGQVIGNGSPIDITFETYSQGKHWLMGFISGENMRRLDTAPPAVLMKQCMDSFVEYFGPTGPEPRGRPRLQALGLRRVLVGWPDRPALAGSARPGRHGAAPADRADPLGRHRGRDLLAGLHGRCGDLRLPHRRRGRRRALADAVQTGAASRCDIGCRLGTGTG